MAEARVIRLNVEEGPAHARLDLCPSAPRYRGERGVREWKRGAPMGAFGCFTYERFGRTRALLTTDLDLLRARGGAGSTNHADALSYAENLDDARVPQDMRRDSLRDRVLRVSRAPLDDDQSRFLDGELRKPHSSPEDV